MWRQHWQPSDYALTAPCTVDEQGRACSRRPATALRMPSSPKRLRAPSAADRLATQRLWPPTEDDPTRITPAPRHRHAARHGKMATGTSSPGPQASPRSDAAIPAVRPQSVFKPVGIGRRHRRHDKTIAQRGWCERRQTATALVCPCSARRSRPHSRYAMPTARAARRHAAHQ